MRTEMDASRVRTRGLTLLILVYVFHCLPNELSSVLSLIHI